MEKFLMTKSKKRYLSQTNSLKRLFQESYMANILKIQKYIIFFRKNCLIKEIFRRTATCGKHPQ